MPLIKSIAGRWHREWLLLGFILLVALGLRLWGIGFGLPYEYHVDEVQYVRQAAAMGARGLEPVWWNNPPFFKYILFAEYAGLFVLGKWLGWHSSAIEFGARHSLDPTWLYLLGRATSAVLGALTVLLAYWMGKVAYNRRVGLLSACFLAVSFIHVRDSHYAVNDIALTFWVAVAMLASLKIVQSGAVRWYVVAGVAMGLFATKYTAGFALLPVIVGHFLSPDVQLKRMAKLRLGRLMVAPVVAGLAAVVGSPYFLLTPNKVIRDVYEALYLAGRQGFEGWQIDAAGGYFFYLKSLVWGLGWALLLLSMTAVMIALLRHTPQDVVLLSLPVVMYAVMGWQQMYFARFILPIVPALLVMGASLLEKLVSSFTVGSKWMGAAMSIGVLIVIAQPLVFSLRHDYLLTQPDTRTLARQWIEANIPEGARIAVDWPVHGPPLSTPEKAVPYSDRVYDVTIVGGTGLADHSIEWYREQGFEYLIASSFIYNIPLVYEERDAARRAFYASLDQELERVHEFRPYQGDAEPPFIFDEIYGPAVSLWQRERPGPTIKIYRIGD